MNSDLYPLKTMRSDLIEDYRRYLEYRREESPDSLWTAIRTIAGSKGLWVIAHYRFGRWINASFKKPVQKPFKIMLKAVYFLGRFAAVCITKTEILVTSKIGPGLFISNNGNVIFAAEVMGKHGTIHHNITSGLGRDLKMPIYGDHVWIGPNSVIYGGIEVGSNTVISGSTVLSKSIPGNMRVGGNPCQIRQKGIDDGPYHINSHLNEE